MRGPTATAPSEESLREMMALAAATASAVAGDAAIASAVVSTTEATRHVRMSNTRSTYNRRQSISQLPALMGAEQQKKGAPLPPVQGGARLQKINEVAREVAAKWVHPRGSLQYETEILHQVRAILYMNRSLITQSFVSQVSGVSQGSLSHYVRGLFRGNQSNVEERLGMFVRTFCEGGYDKNLDEARQGHRLVGRPVQFDPVSTDTVSQQPAAASQSIIAPEPVTDTRPPVPPPPPPQLQPAPWVRPTPPRLPPTPPQQPQPEPVPQGSATVAPDTTSRSPERLLQDMTERARRAHQRQVAQQKQLVATKRPRSAFPTLPEEAQELTPVVAVERAFQVLVAPKWTGEHVDAEPLLIPIELHVKLNNKTLHMFTQWDVNERHLSPEFLSDRIRRARGLPDEFTKPAAMQIRRCLYEAGVICPPPPEMQNAENRRLIKIVVELQEGEAIHVLRDEFEWDLGAGCMNSPEVFAQHLCTDANISQKHASTVATAIKRQVVRAQAIAYGDEETKNMALDGLPEDDPLVKTLPRVISALAKTSAEDQLAREREENEIAIRNWFIKPILDMIPEHAEKRRHEQAMRAAEEKARKELEVLRKRESEEMAKENGKLAKALKDVDEQAMRIHQGGSLDFRPYLALRVGRGERPSLWMPAAFDRRKRKQSTFPMTQPIRRASGQISSAPRSKRRRLSRREDTEEPNKRVKRFFRTTDNDDTGADKEGRVQTKSVFAKLRIRQSSKKESKSRGSERKRRR